MSYLRDKYKDSSNTWKAVYWLTGVGVVITAVVIISRIFGDPKMDDLAKEKLKELNSIWVDPKLMSISEKDAEKRANQLYAAFKGTGFNQVEFVLALTDRTYHPQIKEHFKTIYAEELSVENAVTFGLWNDLKISKNYTLLDKYEYVEHLIGLNKYDFEMISKKFGVRLTGGINPLGVTAWSSKEYFTLRDYVLYEENEQVIELYNYMAAGTRIQV